MTTTKILRAMSLLLLLAPAGGCAFVSQEETVLEVQSAVVDRSGHIAKAPEAPSSFDVQALLSMNMKLPQVVRVALLNNQELQAEYESLGISSGELVSSGMLSNPMLDAELQFGSGAFGVGTTFNLAQELISIIQMPLRRRVAEARLEAAKYQVLGAALALIYESEAAYAELQGAQRVVAISEQQVELARLAAEISLRQRAAGNNTTREHLAQAAQYRAALKDFLETKRLAFEARERLSVLMGLWRGSEKWSLAEELPEPPQEEAVPEYIEALAVSRSAELASQKFLIEALGNELGMKSSSGLLPEFSAGPRIAHEENWGDVGATLALPLPVFNQGQGETRAADARLREAQRRFYAAAVRIRSAVRVAVNQLLLSRAQYDFNKSQVLPHAQKQMNHGQLEYNGMLLGVFDLLEIRSKELEAEKETALSLAAYWASRAALKKVSGGRFEGVSLEESRLHDRKG